VIGARLFSHRLANAPVRRSPRRQCRLALALISLAVTVVAGAQPAQAYVNGDASVITTQAWSHPWLVMLEMTFERTPPGAVNRCSGTLIDATHVLTAAHCFAGQWGALRRVDVQAGPIGVSGQQDRDAFPTPDMMTPAKELVDPDWANKHIALVTVTAPFDYTSTVFPISVIDPTQARWLATSTSVEVAGWATHSLPRQGTGRPAWPASYPGIPQNRNLFTVAGIRAELGDSGGPVLMNQRRIAGAGRRGHLGTAGR
jgi:hypothetical protein